MTTLALVAGMLPLALGTGPGRRGATRDRRRRDRRAVAVLLLTLLVTPVAYSLFDDVVERMRRRRAVPVEAPLVAQ